MLARGTRRSWCCCEADLDAALKYAYERPVAYVQLPRGGSAPVEQAWARVLAGLRLGRVEAAWATWREACIVQKALMQVHPEDPMVRVGSSWMMSSVQM